MPLSLKEQVFEACMAKIEATLAEVRASLQELSTAKHNESKSSVGDKYETGRAMIHLEEEKLSKQLAQAQASKNLLQKIGLQKQREQVAPGSLVYSSQGFYFLAVSLGKLQIAQAEIFCLSAQAPLGKALLHKRVGDSFEMHQKTYEIIAIE